MLLKRIIPIVFMGGALLFACNPQPSETEVIDADDMEEVMDDAEEQSGVIKEGQDFFIDEEGNMVYTFLTEENMPSFAGPGTLNDFVRENLTYPIEARENESEGTVVVDFVVAPDGSIRDARVTKPAEDELLNTEALRVVNLMPAWNPAMKDGAPVAYRFSLPVVFKFEE
ncbi:energy transducer TonB [Fulvivirga sedimenti]|uniref:Energy transducer TonB n=1 Tax=Fulvivirga sedimenti TaxID=2879465 RepID=A0A9X1HSR8_9BACT|nr:energy transducer TonB [Fulvivirga sedimenti]MCA6074557.1 energy transducer TonB [Fulvivirga sedimenti]MCA6075734.1 energy transducer TonB [Fulvivirga sedimenti]MCA6076862.1 energy transducer TonB [Fulvivirga sedimenti]